MVVCLFLVQNWRVFTLSRHPPSLEGDLPRISFQGASRDWLTVALLVPESFYTLTDDLLAHLVFPLRRY